MYVGEGVKSRLFRKVFPQYAPSSDWSTAAKSAPSAPARQASPKRKNPSADSERSVCVTRKTSNRRPARLRFDSLPRQPPAAVARSSLCRNVSLTSCGVSNRGNRPTSSGCRQPYTRSNARSTRTNRFSRSATETGKGIASISSDKPLGICCEGGTGIQGTLLHRLSSRSKRVRRAVWPNRSFTAEPRGRKEVFPFRLRASVGLWRGFATMEFSSRLQKKKKAPRKPGRLFEKDRITSCRGSRPWRPWQRGTSRRAWL